MRKVQVSYKNFVIASVNESIIESNALNGWNFFFKIIDGRISFHCNNLDLKSKPKFTFRNLKKGIH